MSQAPDRRASVSVRTVRRFSGLPIPRRGAEWLVALADTRGRRNSTRVLHGSKMREWLQLHTYSRNALAREVTQAFRSRPTRHYPRTAFHEDLETPHFSLLNRRHVLEVDEVRAVNS